MTRFVLTPAVAIDGTRLLVVARLVIETDRLKQRLWLVASKVPYALVIEDHEGLRALGMSGERLSVNNLVEEVPELIPALGRAAEPFQRRAKGT